MTTAIIGIIACDGCGKEERGEVDVKSATPGPALPEGWSRFTFTDWIDDVGGQPRGMLADVHSLGCAEKAFSAFLSRRTPAEPAVEVDMEAFDVLAATNAGASEPIRPGDAVHRAFGYHSGRPLNPHKPGSWFSNDPCPLCASPKSCPLNAGTAGYCRQQMATADAVRYGVSDCPIHGTAGRDPDPEAADAMKADLT
jgi:hypothetical protein